MSDLILSVVLPNFNDSFFLTARISSILEAMIPNAELIIIDDGSTDRSIKIIEYFASQDQRIKFIKHPQNRGIVYTAQAGLNVARGKFIAFLSANDFIFSDFFTSALPILGENPSIGLCCSITAYCKNYKPGTIPSDIISIPLIDNIQYPIVISANQIGSIFKKTNLRVAGHTAIIRTESCRKFGGFREILGPYCDWMLMHSIALKEGVIYIPKVLAVWNNNQTNYSNISHKNHKRYTKGLLKTLNSEMLELKPLFIHSHLLRNHLKRCFFWLLFNPQYWDILAPLIKCFLKKRIKKVLKKNKS